MRPRWLAPFMLLSAAAIGGIWVSGMIEGPGPDPGWIDYAALSAISLPTVVLAIWLAGRWYVDITDRGITVAHFRGSSTISWHEIVRISADYWGLRIESTSGATTTARAFGVPKWRSYGVPWPSTTENLVLHLLELKQEVAGDHVA